MKFLDKHGDNDGRVDLEEVETAVNAAHKYWFADLEVEPEEEEQLEEEEEKVSEEWPEEGVPFDAVKKEYEKIPQEDREEEARWLNLFLRARECLADDKEDCEAPEWLKKFM